MQPLAAAVSPSVLHFPGASHSACHLALRRSRGWHRDHDMDKSSVCGDADTPLVGDAIALVRECKTGTYYQRRARPAADPGPKVSAGCDPGLPPVSGPVPAYHGPTSGCLGVPRIGSERGTGRAIPDREGCSWPAARERPVEPASHPRGISPYGQETSSVSVNSGYQNGLSVLLGNRRFPFMQQFQGRTKPHETGHNPVRCWVPLVAVWGGVKNIWGTQTPTCTIVKNFPFCCLTEVGGRERKRRVSHRHAQDRRQDAAQIRLQ